MLFMVIERFRPGQAPAAYRRFHDRGRMLPSGVTYISSWVDMEFRRCFQLMEAESAVLVEKWTVNWDDLIEFDIVPVQTSEQAARAIKSGREDFP